MLRNLFKVIKLATTNTKTSIQIMWNQNFPPNTQFKIAFSCIYVFQKELEWHLEAIWSKLSDFIDWKHNMKFRVRG